ncbi:hypothetical protein [Aureliella helgolandensis]|uniref:Phage virion morphogenesis family protein n=1 Tax=Aureliella helgolandensis TaxID=2527968 RepID=A0A518G2U4_9BACT|nr:hypothetical protein [Aureliella helgolandensis]QDV22921.1 hypothetical protein Q31a_12140 [Aureliella helgolandensis]
MAFPIAVQVRERGATPRRMKTAYTAASRKAWHAVALRFHTEYRDKRFTEEHAREAGYVRRKGELLPRDSKAFRRSYTGRKLLLKGHTRPLEFSGKTRRAVRAVSISETSKGGKAAYRGANTFNFRHPKSNIRMSDEFRFITPREARELGEYYDLQLDRFLAEGDKS